MQQMSALWLTDMTAPSRIVEAKVEVYRDSALVYTFLPEDNLVSLNISRMTEDGRMFGFTVCQQATVEVLNPDNAFTIEKDDELKIYVGTETELAKNPTFYVEEVKKDEVKKNITIVAYDVMNKLTKPLQKELTITFPITIQQYATKIAVYIGKGLSWKLEEGKYYSEHYMEDYPPNFSGEETLREVAAAIAELTGSICYIDTEDNLCFKPFGGDPVGRITKEEYFELTLGNPIVVTNISAFNELGEFLGSSGVDGYRYCMRGNPFVDNLPDNGPISAITPMQQSLANIEFYPYTLRWRGNPAFELGDKITVTQANDTTVDIFYFGETLNYNGGLVATSDWTPGEEEELESPPTSIGEAINKTSAKIDKVNSEIVLMAGVVDTNAANISNLALTAEDITASVQSVEQVIQEGLEAVNGEMATLSQKVELGVTAEDVKIAISKELDNGVDKVTTSTGFTFNEEGLNISKSTSDITTTITEDGMRVDRGGETVLTANNEGVQAEDLHATTYLIIGTNSRFEDFGSRTGCFWIG